MAGQGSRPLSTGPYLEDRTPIRFAALVARELGGFTPPPRYAAD
jgi:amidase